MVCTSWRPKKSGMRKKNTENKNREQNIDIVINKLMLFLQKWRKIEKETNS